VVANRPATPAAGEFELAILDVGQGLASVVRTHSHVLVYDAGPAFQSGRDAGELVVTPYLRRRGVRKIDVLMISHGHLDHEGGAKSVISALPVEAMLRGPSVVAAEGGLCERGQQWVWDDVHFTVLHPSPSDAAADNDSSCVLRIHGKGGAALLTGDIEADAEAKLVDAGLASVDIVVAPHHGSRTSSTPEFVAVLRPRMTFFSAGYRNRWGFPRAEIVERWSAVGARITLTAESGAIEASVGADGSIDVREHRETDARYWRRRRHE
jgi:competence protein ComEC